MNINFKEYFNLKMQTGSERVFNNFMNTASNPVCNEVLSVI